MYFLRSTYDASSPRGYIDLFIKAQDENLGNFFTNQDLLIGCQVSLLEKLTKKSPKLFYLGPVYCRLGNHLQQLNVNAALHGTVP